MRRSARVFWALGFAAITTAGVLLAVFAILGDVAHGDLHTARQRFAEEMTGAWGAFVLLPLIGVAHRRFPLSRARIGRWLLPHAGMLLVYSALHTAVLALVHGSVFPVLGVPSDPYTAALGARTGQELMHDILAYGVFLAAATLWDWAAALRDRELRAAQLEAALVDAQLQALRMQLQPHFLFNALNTISSVMYDDPRAADQMIEHLGALLRGSLAAAPAHEVTLAEELHTVGRYAALMQARFDDRLELHLDVPAEAEAACVPALLLQPLLENVMRHGLAVSGQPVRIDIRARVGGGKLALEVTDNGPGSAGAGATRSTGIGLHNTRERLRLLYGDRAELWAGDRAEGGFCVRLAIPAGAAEAAGATEATEAR
ncbi:MAG TPA: histidine kinase [Kofleriaceae bacterium]